MSWIMRECKIDERASTITISPSVTFFDDVTFTGIINADTITSSKKVVAGANYAFYCGSTAVLMIGSTAATPINEGIIIIDLTNHKLWFAAGTTINDWKEIKLA